MIFPTIGRPTADLKLNSSYSGVRISFLLRWKLKTVSTAEACRCIQSGTNLQNAYVSLSSICSIIKGYWVVPLQWPTGSTISYPMGKNNHLVKPLCCYLLTFLPYYWLYGGRGTHHTAVVILLVLRPSHAHTAAVVHQTNLCKDTRKGV